MLRVTVGVLIGVLICGCSPRGESRTVEELYSQAAKRFDLAYKNSTLDNSKQQVLKNIRALVQDFVNSDAFVPLASLINEELKKINHFCHPNTRTSIFEQIETIENLKASSSLQPNFRFYIGARVLNILASELETHQFSYTFSG